MQAISILNTFCKIPLVPYTFWQIFTEKQILEITERIKRLFLFSTPFSALEFTIISRISYNKNWQIFCVLSHTHLHIYWNALSFCHFAVPYFHILPISIFKSAGNAPPIYHQPMLEFRIRQFKKNMY